MNTRFLNMGLMTKNICIAVLRSLNICTAMFDGDKNYYFYPIIYLEGG